MKAKEKARKYLNEYISDNTFSFDEEIKINPKIIEKAIDIAIREAKKELLDIIKTYQNPYPKDIFLWDNKGKLDFSRGRFNKHCYKIVESMRSDLLKEIEEKD